MMNKVQSETEPMQVSNDQQILADLDKIINSLEQQQKNMATFGLGGGDNKTTQEEQKEEAQPAPIQEVDESQR